MHSSFPSEAQRVCWFWNPWVLRKGINVCHDWGQPGILCLLGVIGSSPLSLLPSAWSATIKDSFILHILKDFPVFRSLSSSEKINSWGRNCYRPPALVLALGQFFRCLGSVGARPWGRRAERTCKRRLAWWEDGAKEQPTVLCHAQPAWAIEKARNFTYLFNKYGLSPYCVPGVRPGTGNTVASQTSWFLPVWSYGSLAGGWGKMNPKNHTNKHVIANQD